LKSALFCVISANSVAHGRTAYKFTFAISSPDEFLSEYGERQPTDGFRHLASLLHRRRSMDVNQTLHDVWPSSGLVHYVYTFEGHMPPAGILLGAKFTLRPILAFSSLLLHGTRAVGRGRQPNFAAWYNEWNYRTFTVGATYTAGRPSRWTLAHIASSVMIFGFIFIYSYYSRPA